MAQPALFCLGLLILALSSVLGSIFPTPAQTVLSSNSTVEYNDKSSPTQGRCASDDPKCANKWFIDNADEAGSGVENPFATWGPSSNLSFGFKGSKTLLVGGKCNSNCTAFLGGTAIQLDLNGPRLYHNETLDSRNAYIFTLQTNGPGFATFTGFSIDKHATPFPPTKSQSSSGAPPPVAYPSNPTQPITDPNIPVSTTISPSTSQSLPSIDTSTSPRASLSSGIPLQPSLTGSHGGDPSEPAEAPPLSTSGRAPEKPSQSNGGLDPISGNTGPPNPSPDDPSSGAIPSPGKTSEKHRNSAWIAGAVIGTLIFIIAVLLLVWYARRWIRARRAPSYAFRNGTAGFDIVVNNSPTEVHRESSTLDSWEPFPDEKALIPVEAHAL